MPGPVKHSEILRSAHTAQLQHMLLLKTRVGDISEVYMSQNR